MIRLTDVSKVYDNGTAALDHVNLQIDDGEFVFVVGPSGAGKSTLMKLLLREEEASSGEIEVNGFDLRRIHRKIPQYRRSLGVVFQDFRLIPEMTVYQNIAFSMRVVGARASEIRKRVPALMRLVGLEGKRRCYPDELSGGEQQRVALARAIANNPKLLIADEPTGNVDPKMSRRIMELLTEINSRNTTVLVVTHERTLVNHFKKRVVTLEGGRIVSDRMGGTYNENN